LIVNDLPSQNPGNRRNRGFTLLEVIIALSVFGFLIGGLLALLPWGVEGAGNVRDRNVAYGMTDAVQVELELMGFGWVEKLTHLDPQTPDDDRVLSLVSSADGGNVYWEPSDENIKRLTDKEKVRFNNLKLRYKAEKRLEELPAGERYFLIRCSQFPKDNRHEHDPSNGYLGLQVDVQWPYKTLDTVDRPDEKDGVKERFRSHFHFPMAITR
jgi:prepilin-type N-terminal cleavage/methylation domain-containing protein